MGKHPTFVLLKYVASFDVEMLTELLRQEGIEARGFGAGSGASVGAGESITSGRIEVLADDLERARAVLALTEGELATAEYVDIPAELTDAVPLPDTPSAADSPAPAVRQPSHFALFTLSVLFFLLVLSAVWRAL